MRPTIDFRNQFDLLLLGYQQKHRRRPYFILFLLIKKHSEQKKNSIDPKANEKAKWPYSAFLSLYRCLSMTHSSYTKKWSKFRIDKDKQRREKERGKEKRRAQTVVLSSASNVKSTGKKR